MRRQNPGEVVTCWFQTSSLKMSLANFNMLAWRLHVFYENWSTQTQGDEGVRLDASDSAVPCDASILEDETGKDETASLCNIIQLSVVETWKNCRLTTALRDCSAVFF
ncbi:hypothetical protein OJAV_G00141800 [Oryzias javanicus]|uniref:Uncharacterized protein n=1 Tax=Oryzias javanicus TaxID=123683 RepID=A0A3S2P0U9_ORYJA|nr:hypothetical protein OJAV_G00141800 [Oryzias javanicus]